VIDVRAAGINYADCVTRMGLYASARQYVGYPVTPGFEAAGTVRATGAAITDLAPGMPVIAVTRFGGYATRLAVPRHQVFPLPAGLDFAQAAALPTVALTAWYALFELAHPHAGDTVLVHSAAGGVGSMLVQMGKRAGCRVIGVVGAPHKTGAVHALGADAVVDKSTQDLWRAVERLAPDGCHVVLDANGVSTLAASYRHLAPTGKLVVYGFHSMLQTRAGKPAWLRLARDWLRTPRFSPFDLTTHNRGVLGFNLSYLFGQDAMLQRGMQQILDRVQAGELRLPAVTPYAFADVAAAHRALESGQTTGKLVLLVD
jgi:NADPH:quinone reductase-like Zn-dependent oxidoreductase